MTHRFFRKHCDKCNAPEIKLELQKQGRLVSVNEGTHTDSVGKEKSCSHHYLIAHTFVI